MQFIAYYTDKLNGDILLPYAGTFTLYLFLLVSIQVTMWSTWITCQLFSIILVLIREANEAVVTTTAEQQTGNYCSNSPFSGILH